MTASRPRAFVYAARGPATGGELWWFPAIRWFAPDGTWQSVTILGGHGGDWDTAATRAVIATITAAMDVQAARAGP